MTKIDSHFNTYLCMSNELKTTILVEGYCANKATIADDDDDDASIVLL